MGQHHVTTTSGGAAWKGVGAGLLMIGVVVAIAAGSMANGFVPGVVAATMMVSGFVLFIVGRFYD